MPNFLAINLTFLPPSNHQLWRQVGQDNRQKEGATAIFPLGQLLGFEQKERQLNKDRMEEEIKDT